MCVSVPAFVPERDQRRLPCPSQNVFILRLFFCTADCLVTFLSLVSVSQLYVLPGGNRDGGEGFLGAGGLQKWEVWGMLWSCFYHLETWQEETPGETVEPLHTVSSSDGSRDFFWVLGGWEGSWLV